MDTGTHMDTKTPAFQHRLTDIEIHAQTHIHLTDMDMGAHT
jgi:hypothetical protein